MSDENVRRYAIASKIIRLDSPDDIISKWSMRYRVAAAITAEAEETEFAHTPVFRFVGKNSLNNYEARLRAQEIQTSARRCQERVMAEAVCSLITKKLASLPPDPDCFHRFYIKNKFRSEKIIGRLGYHGLPRQNVSVFFFSSKSVDLASNYMFPHADPPITDFQALHKSPEGVYGPFPDEETVSMRRTFFYSFSDSEIASLRVDYFSQLRDWSEICSQKKTIEKMLGEEIQTIRENDKGVKISIPDLLNNCIDQLDGHSKFLKEVH